MYVCMCVFMYEFYECVCIYIYIYIYISFNISFVVFDCIFTCKYMKKNELTRNMYRVI